MAYFKLNHAWSTNHGAQSGSKLDGGSFTKDYLLSISTYVAGLFSRRDGEP